MSVVSINLLSRRSLKPQADGAIILRLICDLLPGAIPERYGNWEPVRARFDASRLEEALDAAWTFPFLWKRSKPKAEGSVWMVIGPQPNHGWITISLEGTAATADGVVAFLLASSEELETDFAFAHVLTARDLELGRHNGTVVPLDSRRTRFNLSVTTHHLRQFIPDLYWCTVFGRAYVEHFGRERLLATPAWATHELSSGVCFQCSRDFADITRHPDEFEHSRTLIKKHLNTNSFFDPDLPDSHRYSTPTFRLDS
jgi:hypothetical protein